jgi:bifunctional non-homologous end joining protein LigD
VAAPDYAPQLATPVKHAPEGDEWLHEIKYDGYRIGCRIRDGRAALISRDGKDWTTAFPEIAAAAEALRVRDALLDGEIALVLPDGRTSFQALQNVSGRRDDAARGTLAYFVFDLVRLDGERIARLTLDERKARLRRLLGRAKRAGRIRYSDHVEGSGAAFFQRACAAGLEGIVSKRRDQPYRPGRNDGWLKTACALRPDIVEGVRITHADRVVYPELRVTKLDVARYYEAIARWIVPHVAGRPLTLVRCPEGLRSPCFFMKHSQVWAPAPLRRVRIQEKKKLGEYLIADDLPGVIGLVQMGVLEIHTWNSEYSHLEEPNRLVFDLDPGDEVPWARVVEAARLVRKSLDALGLESFVKTTGGSGLHVVVPLVPHAEWTACLAFSRAVAGIVAASDPARFTTDFAKAGRARRILIDYLRNNRTNTSIAAYSTRAKPRATISVPIAWKELSPSLDPASFTIATVPTRLARLRADPWLGYYTPKQKLTRAILRAVGA